VFENIEPPGRPPPCSGATLNLGYRRFGVIDPLPSTVAPPRRVSLRDRLFHTRLHPSTLLNTPLTPAPSSTHLSPLALSTTVHPNWIVRRSAARRRSTVLVRTAAFRPEAQQDGEEAGRTGRGQWS
jgi:hypothetical protein